MHFMFTAAYDVLDQKTIEITHILVWILTSVNAVFTFAHTFIFIVIFISLTLVMHLCSTCNKCKYVNSVMLMLMMTAPLLQFLKMLNFPFLFVSFFSLSHTDLSPAMMNLHYLQSLTMGRSVLCMWIRLSVLCHRQHSSTALL